jgi:hypothetical protein
MAPTFIPSVVKISALLVLMLGLLACNKKKNFYKSDCGDDRAFKHLSYTKLIDSMAYYDKQYVEVSGEYRQGNGESTLFNDTLLKRNYHKKALWVEFSPDCPLYLTGTRIGFFDYDYNGGNLTPANNKKIILRGRINYHYKGNSGAYEGTIEHISYVEF